MAACGSCGAEKEGRWVKEEPQAQAGGWQAGGWQAAGSPPSHQAKGSPPRQSTCAQPGSPTWNATCPL